MPTPSLFTVNALDAAYSATAAVIALIVFIQIFLGPLKHTQSDDNLGAKNKEIAN
jgi:hypothetical protein